MWLIVAARLDLLHPIAKLQHSTVLACMNYTSLELPSPGWTFSDALLIGSSAARLEATPEPNLAGWMTGTSVSLPPPWRRTRSCNCHEFSSLGRWQGLTCMSNHPWELFGRSLSFEKGRHKGWGFCKVVLLQISKLMCTSTDAILLCDKRVVVNFWSAIAQHLAVAKGCWSAIILLWSRVGGRSSCCGGQLC